MIGYFKRICLGGRKVKARLEWLLVKQQQVLGLVLREGHFIIFAVVDWPCFSHDHRVTLSGHFLSALLMVS